MLSVQPGILMRKSHTLSTSSDPPPNTDLSTEMDKSSQGRLDTQNTPYTSQSEVYEAILSAIVRKYSKTSNSRSWGVTLEKMWDQPEELHMSLLSAGETYAVADTMAWLAQNSSLRIHGRSLREWTQDNEQQEDLEAEEYRMRRMTDLQKTLAANFYARRRIVTTGKGFVGNVHGSVRVGDKVAMVSGCSVPVLLRQKEGCPGFEVVGDAYVSSLMWGERYADILARAEWQVVEIY